MHACMIEPSQAKNLLQPSHVLLSFLAYEPCTYDNRRLGLPEMLLLYQRADHNPTNYVFTQSSLALRLQEKYGNSYPIDKLTMKATTITERNLYISNLEAAGFSQRLLYYSFKADFQT